MHYEGHSLCRDPLPLLAQCGNWGAGYQINFGITRPHRPAVSFLVIDNANHRGCVGFSTPAGSAAGAWGLMLPPFLDPSLSHPAYPKLDAVVRSGPPDRMGGT